MLLCCCVVLLVGGAPYTEYEVPRYLVCSVLGMLRTPENILLLYSSSNTAVLQQRQHKSTINEIRKGSLDYPDAERTHVPVRHVVIACDVFSSIRGAVRGLLLL